MLGSNETVQRVPSDVLTVSHSISKFDAKALREERTTMLARWTLYVVMAAFDILAVEANLADA